MLLVVADGIRTSVERITNWINEEIGSTPIKFGLVELRFYALNNGSKIVVPKTLLKTNEISRHVVVDIQNNSTAIASAKVSEPSSASGAYSSSRPIKIAGPVLTKNALLAEVLDDDKAVVQELFEQFESIGLVENTKSSGQLRYGVTHPKIESEFFPIMYFEKNYLWM